MNHHRATQKKIEAIKDFVNEQKIVSVRQLFYHLVVLGLIKNNLSSYQVIDRLVNDLRYDGEIPFGSISDNTNIYGINQYEDVSSCVSEALKDYRSNWNKEFNPYVEVWVEKEALANILYAVTDVFGVLLNPCKGRSKVTQVYQFLLRARGFKESKILYLGDFDPTGLNISENLKEQFKKQTGNIGFNDLFNFGSLFEDSSNMTVPSVLNAVAPTIERIALNEEQLKDLPQSYQKAKSGDPNYKAYFEKYGDTVYELDALTPKQLQDLVFDALEVHRPLDKIEELKKRDSEERKKILQKLSEVD